MPTLLQKAPNLLVQGKLLDGFSPDTPLEIVRDILLEAGMPETLASQLWQDHYGEFHVGKHAIGPSPFTTDERWGKISFTQVQLEVKSLAVLVRVPEVMLNLMEFSP